MSAEYVDAIEVTEIPNLQATVPEDQTVIDIVEGGLDRASIPDPIVIEKTWASEKLRQGVHLKWSDVTLEIQTKQGPRSILKTCSGIARPGEIVALMGPSGCGKTTLLNILSGRINATRGSLLANGAPLTSSFARISGYVTQDDIFLGNLTVREQLTYAALLRLPKAMTRAQKLERVDKILIELGLSSCAETRIGTELVRGVSGGEKKRVNIATELLSQPSILFLDEPTSGLDAFTSLALMQTLRHVAASGCTVVMSIHQPRADIFHAFDSVMLLSAGETVYFGRGSAAMMDWFAAHGATCPPLSNPADYYKSNAKRLLAQPVPLVDGLCVAYAKDPALHEFESESSTPAASALSTPTPKGGGGEYNSTWFTQLSVVTGRSSKQYYREKMTTVVRVSQGIVIALLTGSVFWNLGLSQTSIENRLGALFFILQGMTFPVIGGVVTLFQTEKASEFPMQVIVPFTQAIVVYWMLGLHNTAERFFLFVLALVLVTLCSTALGIMVSCFVPNANVGIVIAPVLMILFLLVSGFLINEGDIPEYYVWLKYLSFLKYGYEMMVVNEFKGLTFDCSSTSARIGRCITSGEQVLAFRNFNADFFWRNFGILLSLIVAFMLLAYAALRIISRKKTGFN